MAEYSLINRIEFYPVAKRNDALSTKDKPVWEPKIYINFIRGDGTNFARPAYARDFEEFHEEYAAFQKSQKLADKGSPLNDLQGITLVEIKTLNELGVLTIEGLAQTPLSAMKELGDRYEQLRQYATVYLTQRRDMESVFELKTKLEEAELEIARLKAGSKLTDIPSVGEALAIDVPKVALEKEDAAPESESVADPFAKPAKKRGRPAAVVIDSEDEE